MQKKNLTVIIFADSGEFCRCFSCFFSILPLGETLNRLIRNFSRNDKIFSNSFLFLFSLINSSASRFFYTSIVYHKIHVIVKFCLLTDKSDTAIRFTIANSLNSDKCVFLTKYCFLFTLLLAL